jgi:hypothetical protein
MHFSEVIRDWLGWCPQARTFNDRKHRHATGSPDLSSGYPERPPSAALMGNIHGERYRNTQVGIIFTAALIIGVLGTLFNIITHGISGFRFFSILMLLPITALLLTSTTLTVIVSDRQVKVYHGPLAFRKIAISLTEIVSARNEKNARLTINRAAWYFSPKKFTFEKGVVIEQEGGKTFWIGTDEPDALVKAILSAQGECNAPH